ncbi:MAG: hypothetical protein KAH32_00115, partial [Chlamydiia bacterium]|nr:hypothetical protein [Chlamydiia bacterium]
LSIYRWIISDGRIHFGIELRKRITIIAISFDMLLGAVFMNTLNALFVKSSGYQIGTRIGETISSALGKNQEANTLRTKGKLLVALLDYLESDHCKKAINISCKDTKLF